MNQQDLSQAKDPDLTASLAAMKRAAIAARKMAVQTDTNIVIVKNNQIERISADVLRVQLQGQAQE
jgi:hypothetical protein